MKRLLIVLYVTAMVMSVLSAKELLDLNRNGVGIQGYDPVAFFYRSQSRARHSCRFSRAVR